MLLNAQRFIYKPLATIKGKMQPIDKLMNFRKLKLQKTQCFVDSLTGKLKELEKVFLPTRFNLAYAGKHISILLWYRLIFKGKSKIEKSLLATRFMIEDKFLLI